MNARLLVNLTFAGTVVDPAPVSDYLFSLRLGYYEHAYRRGASEEVLKTLNRTELFEVMLRRYIGGTPKTLHQVFVEVRSFQQYNAVVASGMIRLTIIGMRRDFLKNEWYELMPRFEKAVAKIEKLLSKPA